MLFAQEGTKLPFEISQSRVIFFDHTDLSSSGRARIALQKQIEASLSGKARSDRDVRRHEAIPDDVTPVIREWTTADGVTHRRMTYEMDDDVLSPSEKAELIAEAESGDAR